MRQYYYPVAFVLGLIGSLGFPNSITTNGVPLLAPGLLFSILFISTVERKSFLEVIAGLLMLSIGFSIPTYSRLAFLGMRNAGVHGTQNLFAISMLSLPVYFFHIIVVGLYLRLIKRTRGKTKGERGFLSDLSSNRLFYFLLSLTPIVELMSPKPLSYWLPIALPLNNWPVFELINGLVGFLAAFSALHIIAFYIYQSATRSNFIKTLTILVTSTIVAAFLDKFKINEYNNSKISLSCVRPALAIDFPKTISSVAADMIKFSGLKGRLFVIPGSVAMPAAKTFIDSVGDSDVVKYNDFLVTNDGPDSVLHPTVSLIKQGEVIHEYRNFSYVPVFNYFFDTKNSERYELLDYGDHKIAPFFTLESTSSDFIWELFNSDFNVLFSTNGSSFLGGNSNAALIEDLVVKMYSRSAHVPAIATDSVFKNSVYVNGRLYDETKVSWGAVDSFDLSFQKSKGRNVFVQYAWFLSIFGLILLVYPRRES